MHKPIFILTDSEKQDECNLFIESHLMKGDSEIDWYQGIKESGRWNPEYSYFDKAKPLVDPKSMGIITKFLKSQKVEILDWLKKGNKELKEGKENLSWILSNFSIASGYSPIHIFDNTGYSDGAVIDKTDFDNILKWNNKNKTKLYLKGFDVHY